MRIVAVVLNWRRPDDTIACLASLRETAPEVDAVVVDNASGDRSVETIRAADASAEIVQNRRNEGYAGGNNRGIEAAIEAGADAVLVLNNDVTLRPGCVQTLAAELRRGVQVAAPLSLRAAAPDICDFYRAEVDLRNLAVRAYGRDEPWTGATETVPTDYATGSAMLIDAALVSDVGAFDERYFLVWEDVDLCARAWESRRRVVVVPRAEVLHAGSVSFGGAGSPLYRYFFVRNSFLVVRTHVHWPRRARALAMIERRYRTGIEREADASVRRALRLGLEHGLAQRWGPPPEELLPA